MKLRLLFVLVCTLLAVSACVVEPFGGGGRGGYYEGGRGGHYEGGQGQHEYGRRVWR
jgi:hypothetical protein